MFSRLEIRDNIKKKLPAILRDYWEKLSDEGKNEIIEKTTDRFEKEIEGVQDTLFEADNRADDLIFYFLGIFVGISGNLVANIIQSFLGKFGVLYYAFSFIFFILTLFFLVYLTRNRISKIYRRNKTVKEILEDLKKEIKQA